LESQVKIRLPLTWCLPVSAIFTLSSLGDTPPYPTPSRAPQGKGPSFSVGHRSGLKFASCMRRRTFRPAPNLIETPLVSPRGADTVPR
jgi:hypothetical protein